MDKISNSHERLNLFDFITLSTLNVGIGAFSLALICIYAITQRLDYGASLISGIIAYFGYTFDNISGISAEDMVNKPKRYYFRKKYGKACILVASTLFGVLVIFSFIQSLLLGIAVLIPEIAVILYSVDLEKRLGIPALKKILLFKNLFSVVVWIFVVVVIPLIYLGENIDRVALIVILQLFAVLFINLVICDINDVEGDLKNGIKTVPILIGKKKTIIMGFIINTVSVIVYIMLSKGYISLALMAIFSTNIYTFIYLFYYAGRKDCKIHNPFVDSVLIVPLIVFIIGDIIIR